MKLFDEHGITGNSGIVPGGHVSANFSAGDGNVFILVEDFWKRISKSDLKPEMKIVECVYCKKPAISIDHHYPYESEFNYCKDHKPS